MQLCVVVGGIYVCMYVCMYVYMYVHMHVTRTMRSIKFIYIKQACEERRWHFTPFVCSVDGAMGKEAVGFLKRIASKLNC